MTWKLLLILIAANFLYIVLGGVVFHHLEKKEEDTNRELVRESLHKILTTHDCINHTDLESIISVIIRGYENGIIATNNASSMSNWDLTSSVFFSGTVVTTIGYGFLAPSTVGGRGFCGLYAIFGIPIMMVMLAGIGQKLHLGVETAQQRFRPGANSKKRKAWRCVIMVGVGVASFLVVPALIFKSVEGWSFSASFYYGIITLSTIGFGDYVAGVGEANIHRDLYRVFVCLWLLFGLAWLAGVLAVMQDLVNSFIAKTEETIQTYRHSIRNSRLESLDVNTVEQVTLSKSI